MSVLVNASLCFFSSMLSTHSKFWLVASLLFLLSLLLLLLSLFSIETEFFLTGVKVLQLKDTCRYFLTVNFNC